jgi:C4-type Zn-finger protein
VVKTEWAEIQIPEIEFEVKKQNGMVTTIEGVLDRAIEGLQQTMQMVLQIILILIIQK